MSVMVAAGSGDSLRLSVLTVAGAVRAAAGRRLPCGDRAPARPDPARREWKRAPARAWPGE